VTLLNFAATQDPERAAALRREALAPLDLWIEQGAEEVRPRQIRGRTRHALCDTAGARADYAFVLERGDPAQRGEAAELTVESLVEEGDAEGARTFAAAARRSGADSDRLRAFAAALASGEPPPTPRCPRSGPAGSPAGGALPPPGP